jgi:hypothetical protein
MSPKTPIPIRPKPPDAGWKRRGGLTDSRLVSLSRVPPLEVDVWKPQNVYYQLVEALSGANQTRISGAWLDRLRGLGKWLGRGCSSTAPGITLQTARQNRVTAY